MHCLRLSSLFVAFGFVVVGIPTACADLGLEFSLGSIVGKTTTGGNLEGLTIRIGTFQTITPTFSNYGLWNADFADLTGISTGVLIEDTLSFVTPPSSEFGPLRASGDAAETYTGSYPTGIDAGDQIYVWIYNSTTPSATTEAILITQSTWILPSIPSDPTSKTFGWINGQAGAGALSIVGGVGLLADNSYVDTSSELGVRILTSVVPEPNSAILFGAAIVGFWGMRRWPARRGQL